ncbi:dTDP-4-dehydrorhamnose 3,5-epimerase family protein [Azotobacter salinestris]|uniref:dTDP-4-dehydrorhamnose 3,5-epimerase family protein n=1 Tax=Azotobacter salinestris TaxID=69964 RepID=UPI0032E04DFF
MSRFSLSALPLAGLMVVERHPLSDSRGFLARLFCAEELTAAGWNQPIVQINHTYTAKSGTVRGLHFQRPPHAEMKLLSCLHGEVWDVVVDLRADSPTFLQWHAERLSAANGRALLIPEGFAHGFQALSDDVELLYCHSAAYAAEAEAGLHPLDPWLDIRWPLETVQMSPRDASHPLIESGFEGVCL